MRKTKILTCLLAAVLCMAAFPITAFAGGGDYYEDEPLPTAEPEEPAIEEGEPLSEETDFFTRDLLYDKHTNKQFITVQDRDGNLFYIVIDYDAPVNEEEEQYQTYFLNAVDVADLEALTEDGDEEPPACSCTDKCVVGDINTSCEVCAANMGECAGKEPEPEPEPTEPEEPVEEPDEGGGMGVILVVILLLAAGGGAAFYFLKIKKNKPQTKGSDDLDDYDYGEDDEDEDYEAGDDLEYGTDTEDGDA